MIQADAPMCEEKGRDGKWERIKCSPVGCCKSGFYVKDYCGCLVRCLGQTETLSSIKNIIFLSILFLYQECASTLGSSCGNFQPHCAPGLKCVYKKSRCHDPDFDPWKDHGPDFRGCLPQSYRTGICKSKNNVD